MGKLNSSEFTDDNLISYAKACREIAWDMPRYDFDTLLIPSRGAVPIFIGITYALKYLGKENKVHKDLLDRMTAPLTIRKGIIPLARDRPITENDINILPYPLTADISIDRYEKRASNDFYSEEIRKSNVKVIKNFFKEPHERIKDPHFKFFSDVLNKIENRGDLASDYADNYPKIKNLAMIDTVISGRAVATILNALGEEGIYPQTFLVVDNSGEKVRKDFQDQLGYKKDDKTDEHFLYQKRLGRTVKTEINIDRRKIKPYDVNRIMTEDTGCALQGVSATLYPSLIVEGSRKLFPQLKSGVAAGSWYAIPKERNHKKILYHFLQTLKAAVNFECADHFRESFESVIERERVLENKRKTLVELLDKIELPEINEDNLCTYYPHYNISNIEKGGVYESGAQVLHIAFTKNFTDYFIDSFNNSIAPSIITEKKDRQLEERVS